MKETVLTPTGLEAVIYGLSGAGSVTLAGLRTPNTTVSLSDVADTLAAYVVVVQAVADMQPYDCACIFCGEQAGAPEQWQTVDAQRVELGKHWPDCIYLAARKLRGMAK